MIVGGMVMPEADVIWCEDCARFHAYGMDGEGECDKHGSTWYGCDASHCPDFEKMEEEQK